MGMETIGSAPTASGQVNTFEVSPREIFLLAEPIPSIEDEGSIVATVAHPGIRDFSLLSADFVLSPELRWVNSESKTSKSC
jgi:hypothetical protein